ncbi:MAG TPA: PIN domain-containing protein [Nitrospirae bacterium]|nr:tRNA(fMet)-specific endonuclease VapC [bacterium BMS3Abin10]GBE40006.1 tRNA(fMet)-specific endonuclease VapC [bacterium BMS3Bbin08]HDH51006.1 PIN domain-containing protein [Nitrospirota bacterium]HDK82516.1 PIN domain-containing protein [Nitrospirota bacterium]
MPVLVDTSIWVEYFRNGNNLKRLDLLIDENLVVTNDLILAELIPFLKIRKQRKIIELLNNVNKLQLNIRWDDIIDYQVKCLRKGINRVGIPDLIIAQNAKQNDCEIYSSDNHFKLLKNAIDIKMTA